jgi:hypothetical protein
MVSQNDKFWKQIAILKKELFKIFHTFPSTQDAQSDTGFR